MTKGKKIALILGISAIIVVATVLIVMGINSNSNKNEISENQNNSSAGSLETSKFSYIYNFSEISDEFWNAENEYWAEYNVSMTNKEAVEGFTSNSIGNLLGNIAVKTTGFSQTVDIKNGYETEFYTLNLKQNDFLFMRQIEVLGNSSSAYDDQLYFYVIGNDLKPYQINFDIEKNPKDVELNEGEWIMQDKGSELGFNCYAFYKINDDYCLQIKFPDVITDEGLNKFNKTREEYPQDEADVKELREKVTSLITLTKNTDQKRPDERYFTVTAEDCEIAEGITVTFNKMKLSSWHSGNTNSNRSNNPLITVLGLRYIEEYSNKSELDEYINSNDVAMKEYTYKNKNIYIVYFTDEALDEYRGKYTGIVINNGDSWYQIAAFSDICDPTTSDVDAWIEELCTDMISFK